MLRGMPDMRRRAVGRKVSVMLALLMALPGLLPASQAAMAAPQPTASITTGYEQTCAIETGRAYCWGSGGKQLGDGSTAASGTPVAVDTTGALAGKTLTRVSAGDDFTCALDTAGRAYCWGANVHGELGDGNTADTTEPAAVHLANLPVLGSRQCFGGAGAHRDCLAN